MSKIHNFSAGPSILAESAFEKSIQDIKNFAGTGLSILEVSHRGKEFEKVMADTSNLVKTLLGVPDDYDVLFLQGGASTQFFQIPLNFLKTKAAYTDTGTWANRALIEAKGYGEVNVVASSKASNYSFIPKDYQVPQYVDYFHCTSNNTIFGTQIKQFPDCGNTPLICDMSSDIFSKPVDVSKFAMIYAGAQKNMGPAGVTLVIIKKDMYEKMADRHIPTMMKYKIHADNDSMYNTPPVFPILVSKYNLEWMLSAGGVEGMAKRNQEKADLLYNAIDNSPYFKGTTAVEDRSQMNVCFVFEEEHIGLEEKFNAACKEVNLSGLKGHRSVGGYRASLYNALPLESVQALVNVMETFAS
ncbi:MAG: 3-phosphoserine/phosphohydroxythreonine aminotransferase [Flavobacteriales bacterium]|nr:MAG: 3-phosphoserine/phosphohydroxythreonine aminotransferase [Flavobacteriales bacterium]